MAEPWTLKEYTERLTGDRDLALLRDDLKYSANSSKIFGQRPLHRVCCFVSGFAPHVAYTSVSCVVAVLCRVLCLLFTHLCRVVAVLCRVLCLTLSCVLYYRIVLLSVLGHFLLCLAWLCAVSCIIALSGMIFCVLPFFFFIWL